MVQGINEKILSFDYKEYKAEIETADAQNSYKDGVIVLVTGCLTSKDNLKRKFAQSFFLAPQENGFFVLNDVFRYVEDGEQLKNHSINGVNDAIAVLSNQEPGKFFVFFFSFVTVVRNWIGSLFTLSIICLQNKLKLWILPHLI